jgi:cbb3-type cytochrome oxidase maturation protein
MSVIYILLIISLIMASIFLGVFIWNLRSGQFEDDYTPGVRVLFEDKPTPVKPQIQEESKKGCSNNCPTCKCLVTENWAAPIPELQH